MMLRLRKELPPPPPPQKKKEMENAKTTTLAMFGIMSPMLRQFRQRQKRVGKGISYRWVGGFPKP